MLEEREAQFVRSDRDTRESEPTSLVGECHCRGLKDKDRDTGDRTAVLECDSPHDATGILPRHGRRYCETEDKNQKLQQLHEI